MKYPRIVNWLIWKKAPDGRYVVRDCVENRSYILQPELFAFARKLDGKHDPYTVMPHLSEKEVDRMLKALDRKELLRYSRVLVPSPISFYYSLWIPRHTRSRSMVPGVLDLLRRVLWLPVLIGGILCFPDIRLQTGRFWLLLFFAGIFLGILCHELSHMVACLRRGGRVFELGFNLDMGMPAYYVLLTMEYVRHTTMDEILVDSAGVECNAMLTGIFLMLAALIPAESYGLCMAASVNFLLAVVNILPVRSTDGMKILGQLLGRADFASDNARTALKDRNRVYELRRRGAAGHLQLAAGRILNGTWRLMNTAFTVLCIIEVIELCRMLLA